MDWLNASYLYLLVLVPAVIALMVWAAHRRRQALERFGDPVLISALTEGVSSRRRRWKGALLAAGVLFLVIALAGPRSGTQMREITREGVDLVIALDVSESMLAEDVAPSRLARARWEISRLVDDLPGSRLGLVAFAGDAVVQCPLTHDRGAFRMLLDVADPYIMPVPGTDIGAAIQTAIRAFETSGQDVRTSEPRTRVLLVVSDGEDHGSGVRRAVNDAQQAGIVIMAAGVGERSGAPIPLRAEGQTGYKLDRDGNVVQTRLNDRHLRDIAADGAYFHIGAGSSDFRQITGAIGRLDQTRFSRELIEDYAEQFQWPLVLALLLLGAERLVSEYRRPIRKKQTAAA